MKCGFNNCVFNFVKRLILKFVKFLRLNFKKCIVKRFALSICCVIIKIVLVNIV